MKTVWKFINFICRRSVYLPLVSPETSKRHSQAYQVLCHCGPSTLAAPRENVSPKSCGIGGDQGMGPASSAALSTSDAIFLPESSQQHSRLVCRRRKVTTSRCFLVVSTCFESTVIFYHSNNIRMHFWFQVFPNVSFNNFTHFATCGNIFLRAIFHVMR